MAIPLHRTRAERLAAGDPRPSLEELYGDHEGYVEAVAEAAEELAEERLLLLDRSIQKRFVAPWRDEQACTGTACRAPTARPCGLGQTRGLSSATPRRAGEYNGAPVKNLTACSGSGDHFERKSNLLNERQKT